MLGKIMAKLIKAKNVLSTPEKKVFRHVSY